MPPTASTTRRIVRSPAREACSLLPHEPGVYRFRDERDRVMYVGRASDLRSRTRSYWGDLHGRRHLRRMVGQIARVEALVCQSVHEAAWLERNLLTRSLARWNRTRGGQEVPVWFVLDPGPRAPSLSLRYGSPPDPELGFGPYLGSTRARLARSGALRAWPVHLTGTHLDAGTRSIGEARGVDPSQRAAVIAGLVGLLRGVEDDVAATRARLVESRSRAAAQLGYELAGQIQEELAALEWSVAPQTVAGCTPPDLRVAAWHDGLPLTLRARDGFVDVWRTRDCPARQGAQLIAATPPGWQQFADRNVRLLVALRDAQAGAIRA